DAFHISRPDAERAQWRTDFLLALDSKRHLPSLVGMEGPDAFEQMRPLARIHDDHPFGMIDHPYIGRQPAGPVSIGEEPEPAAHPVSPARDLRRLDPDRASLNRVDVHTFLKIDRTTSGRSK